MKLKLNSGLPDTHFFRYCCLCGECSGSSTLLELQKLQNRADRILTKRAFDAPSKPNYKEDRAHENS